MLTHIRLALTKIGLPPKNAGTASSIMLCPLTKLKVVSGSVFESAAQRPGRGDGSLIFGTGSQLELAVSCSLKAPSKVSRRSRSRNAQMAFAEIEFFGVVNTP